MSRSKKAVVAENSANPRSPVSVIAVCCQSSLRNSSWNLTILKSPSSGSDSQAPAAVLFWIMTPASTDQLSVRLQDAAARPPETSYSLKSSSTTAALSRVSARSLPRMLSRYPPSWEVNAAIRTASRSASGTFK